MMEKLESTIFYSLDKAIKTYRQFAQRRLYEAGLEITIDQWLVLQAMTDRPGINQQGLAERVFKDAASVTRIIDLLIKKNYVERELHPSDRRRFQLKITPQGKALLKSIGKVVAENRQIALSQIPQERLAITRDVLNTIVENCSPINQLV